MFSSPRHLVTSYIRTPMRQGMVYTRSTLYAVPTVMSLGVVLSSQNRTRVVDHL